MNPILAYISFTLYYIKEVILSGTRVAWDVLTPGYPFAPGVVSVNTGKLTDRQRLLLANLVTMTPGTVSVDYSPNRETLLVHCLYAKTDAENVVKAVNKRYLPIVRSLRV
jgi:multicomponent Na+:H+ antiporter subunit E